MKPVASALGEIDTAMLTIFEVFRYLLIAVGLLMAFPLGYLGVNLFGWVGGLFGAALGVSVGVMGSNLYIHAALLPAIRATRCKSDAKLRAELRDDACRTPNLILLELVARGAATSDDLDAVLNMLAADDIDRRGRGWAALCSAFPRICAVVPEYRIDASREDREKAVVQLRHQITEAMRPR